MGNDDKMCTNLKLLRFPAVHFVPIAYFLHNGYKNHIIYQIIFFMDGIYFMAVGIKSNTDTVYLYIYIDATSCTKDIYIYIYIFTMHKSI